MIAIKYTGLREFIEGPQPTGLWRQEWTSSSGFVPAPSGARRPSIPVPLFGDVTSWTLSNNYRFNPVSTILRLAGEAQN